MKLTKEMRTAIDQNAVKANERIHDELKGLAGDIARDQADWLDKTLKDILPPELYEEGKRGRMLDEIDAYLNKHGFKLIYVPDSLRIRMMRNDQIHAEFITKITVDGE